VDYKELEWWAESQGRPTANLANFLIESSLRQARERGEILSRKKPHELTPVGAKEPKQTNRKKGGEK
jgi:hypothetical protein